MAQPASWVIPHPPPVFRLLKTAWRLWLASGAACSIDVTKPANQVVAAVTVVAGTVWVPPGVRLPATVNCTLMQGAVNKGTRVATVATDGTYTTTFPVSTLAAGTAFARVASTSPADTTDTTTFTVT